MKTSVICMVRNEHDIIEYFCRHLQVLFDTIVIIDHLSEDGTREYLEMLSNSDGKFHVYNFTDPGHAQSALMNFGLRKLAPLEDSDWIFLLDADEFLPFGDKDSFLRALNNLSESPVIGLPWKNLIPLSYDNAGSFLSNSIWVPKHTSSYQKIAFQPKRIRSTDFWVVQGNHCLKDQRCGDVCPTKSAFPIYHLPIRSVEQLAMKLLQGITSAQLNPMKRPGQGRHIREIYETSRKEGLSREILNWLVANYGEHRNGKIGRLHDGDLPASNYELKKIEIAQGDIPSLSHKVPISELLFRVTTTLLGSNEALHEMDSSLLKLEVDAESQIRWKVASFSSFEKPCEPNPTLRHLEGWAFLREFLRPAMYPIKVLPPSAWSGHIPFMFCLIAAVRPRRYVEMGVHHGGSFFAACQAYQDNRLEGRCIAVDNWEGDQHAGFHDESVFADFRSRLSRDFSDVGSYIKGDFSEASSYFSKNSIDILHIDGFHTYDAVSNDYSTWQHKLTKEGVILFHDIAEYRDDFGVWSFWSEVSNQHRHLEFPHCHGLGLLYLGDDSENPIYKLTELCLSNRNAYDYLQWFFENIGEVSVNCRAALQERDSALQERDSALQERDSALQDLDAAYSNVYWRAGETVRSFLAGRPGLKAMLKSTVKTITPLFKAGKPFR